MTIFRDIFLGLWRLLPANPILTRVVAQGSRRSKHLWARAAYLIVLFVVVVLQGGIGGYDTSLAESAKKSTQVFLVISVAQLLLMSFIAPIFCAGAITQEKDSNTYNILLTTPLSSAQIVLGSLFSRIFFVWALLLSGLPIFCITMIFGGVTTAEVFQSFGLAACTGLITGSIAIMISFLKIGTRRTIFFFFAGVAIYLLAVGAMGVAPWGQLAEAPLGEPAFGTGTRYRMSWLAPIHPFLALMVVTGQTPAPTVGEVMNYGWPRSWIFAYPQYAYMLFTTITSIAMVALSVIFVRRCEQEGEATLLNRVSGVFRRRHEDSENTTPLQRKPRRVWRNPIAWREASTRGSSSGGPWVRWAVLIVGIGIGLFLLIAYNASWWPTLNVSTVSNWLTALIWIELAVVLLVVTNTAASTLTRERESQTMEILLTTPLTSKYIVAGMLQGLVRYVVPLIAIPTATLAMFYVVDLMRGTKTSTSPEAILLVPLLMIAVASTAAMIGLQFSLTMKRTVQAVMISTSIVLGVSGALWFCGSAVIINTGLMFSSVILPFFPFPATKMLIDPSIVIEASQSGYNGTTASTAALATARGTRVIFTLISALAYFAITFALYKNMVRSFDMVIRRQST
ncbi:MAG: ABC transporter permease subunit [Phycisphaerae bacterium]